MVAAPLLAASELSCKASPERLALAAVISECRVKPPIENTVAKSTEAGSTSSIVEGTPKSVRAQKRLMRRWERLPLDEAVQAGIDAFAESVGEGEHIERMTAFVNRKKKS